MVRKPLSKQEDKDPMAVEEKKIEIEVDEDLEVRAGEVLLLKGLPVPDEQVTDNMLKKGKNG